MHLNFLDRFSPYSPLTLRAGLAFVFIYFGWAAGALLISEAGGLISDLRGDANYLDTGNVIAGTPKVFAPLLKVVQSHLPESIRG